MAKDKEKDELRILLGETKTLSTGEKVKVLPVPFSRLGEFEEVRMALMMKVEKHRLDITDISNLNKILKIANEEIVAVMAFVLGKDKKWFDTLRPKDGWDLFEVVVRDNFDEDSKKNMERLAQALVSLLPSPSNILSSAGIDLKTSKVTG